MTSARSLAMRIRGRRSSGEAATRPSVSIRVSNAHVVLPSAAARSYTPLAILSPCLCTLALSHLATPPFWRCSPRASRPSSADMPSRAPPSGAVPPGLSFSQNDGRLAAPMRTADGGASSSAGVFYDTGGFALAGAAHGVALPPGLTPWPAVAPIGAPPGGGYVARPPSPVRASPQLPAGARHRGGAPSPRGRSPSPRLPLGIPAEDASLAPAVAQPAGLTNADVFDKVKRSFASVRAGLTEQRAQSVELARQMAAGMTKIDQLTVAHEGIAASRAAGQAVIAEILQRINEVKELVAAADGDAGEMEEEEEEDPDAWVGLTKVCFLAPCR